MCKFVVVEIVERNLCCVIPVDDFVTGLNMANKMLKERIAENRIINESYEPKDGDYKIATSADSTAWLVANDTHWAAHVTPLVGLDLDLWTPKSPANDTYLLYGTCIIENDETLKDFCHSLFKNTPWQGAKSITEVMKLVEMQISFDLPRTKIDYEALLKRYVTEIGAVLVEMEANKEPAPSLDFKGVGAKEFFDTIVRKYIMYHLTSILGKDGYICGWVLEEDKDI